MREVADAGRIRRFMELFGGQADEAARLYFTGGATAVLLGWRPTTIDVDIRFLPESDRLFRIIPGLKEKLELNIELAWPPDFIPELSGWAERSQFIEQQGKVSFFHYDFYSQALAKIERGHQQDSDDVQEMVSRKLVEEKRLWQFFKKIKPALYRYPAIDPPSFEKAVREFTGPAPR